MKIEVLIICSMFLVLFGGTFASAVADVGYIYRKSFNVDQNIINALEEMGLTVELVSESTLPKDLSKYKFIFVGDENFRKESSIPVNDVPTVLVNYYEGAKWGLTDNEGVSKLAMRTPLKVKKNGQEIQVYTLAIPAAGKPAIAYYYLDKENIASGLETVAETQETASDSHFGDVIAYASPGVQMANGKMQNSKLCFFGIVESDFWTTQAKNLFKDCVGFVASECQTDSDCPASVLSEPFCQDGDVYAVRTSYTCESNPLPQCVATDSLELVEDCAFACENGTCVGECDSDADCGTDMQIGDLFCSSNLTVSRMFQQFKCNNPGTPNSVCSSETLEQDMETCEDLCVEGECKDVVCFTNRDCDDTDSSTKDTCHNAGTVESFCTNEPIACFSDADCGEDGFLGDNFCSQGNVLRIFREFECKNAGETDSYCSTSDSERLVETCEDLCVSGECYDVECENDSECDDSNPLTLDQCINPGSVASECRNTLINCASNNDCGFTGFVGSEFCSGLGITKNFQNATCLNAGTLESSCSVVVNPIVLAECEFACSQGVCIRCDKNTDCDDSDSNTVDSCNNPGTLESYCANEPVIDEIACVNDADCGETAAVGEEFCFGGDVTQLFEKFTCHNPNTTLSYCSSNIAPQLTEDCADTCLAGECVSIECYNHEDCDDDNDLTLDICNEAGTVESFCSHSTSEIECFSDSDCGVGGQFGESFCFNNDVFSLSQDYECNFPGTAQSFCSSSIERELVEDCSYLCSNGACIPLTECVPGQTRQCGLTNVGECKLGVETCKMNWQWGMCIGAVYPSIEVCDGKDNNCNGLTDENNVCGPSCSNECSFGERQCVDNGYKICGYFDSDSCTEWSSVVECDTEETCQGGFCVPIQQPTCTNECVFGARQCSGNSWKLCAYFDSDPCTEWSILTNCGPYKTCNGGFCL